MKAGLFLFLLKKAILMNCYPIVDPEELLIINMYNLQKIKYILVHTIYESAIYFYIHFLVLNVVTSVFSITEMRVLAARYIPMLIYQIVTVFCVNLPP